jgi:hypothetical protein
MDASSAPAQARQFEAGKRFQASVGKSERDADHDNGGFWAQTRRQVGFCERNRDSRQRVQCCRDDAFIRVYNERDVGNDWFRGE